MDASKNVQSGSDSESLLNSLAVSSILVAALAEVKNRLSLTPNSLIKLSLYKSLIKCSDLDFQS